MAEKRMFTKKITDSDAFIEMSAAAQALYLHLNQGADDDGFNNQIEMAKYKAHASTDDLKILIAKKFVIQYENGVIVIKHWRLHNTLRKDRYTPTSYQDEFSMLEVGKNGVYTFGCHLVAKRLPQSSRGEYSLDKCSLDKCSRSVVGDDNCGNEDNGDNNDEEYGDEKITCIGGELGKGVIYLSDRQMTILMDKLGMDAFHRYMDRLSSYIIEKNAYIANHFKTILKWYEEDSKV